MKTIHAIYLAFFMICLAVFVILNEASSSVNRDSVLMILITLFGVVIIFYDFNRRLSLSMLSAYSLPFIIINLFIIGFLWLSKLSFPVLGMILLFMIEGSFMYWLLENRASNKTE